MEAEDLEARKLAGTELWIHSELNGSTERLYSSQHVCELYVLVAAKFKHA